MRILTVLWYLLTGRCGHVCSVVEPYGLMPEAGCPIHDTDSLLIWCATKIRQHKPESIEWHDCASKGHEVAKELEEQNDQEENRNS